MWERRATMILCVLLVHALAVYLLVHQRPSDARLTLDEFASEPITLFLEPIDEPIDEPNPADSAAKPAPDRAPSRAAAPPVAAAATPPSTGESAAITPAERVDWPIEAKKSAARVLAAEAEAERVARMFAGPGGTWASLTKRQRSQLNKFRWKPGVDGLEYDDKGNAIYRLPNGCTIVNLAFIGCPIGKQKVHGDMFDNMQLYFDEQRLPRTDEGNGTEPEALRPSN